MCSKPSYVRFFGPTATLSLDPLLSFRISFLITPPELLLLNSAFWKFSTYICLMSFLREGGSPAMNCSLFTVSKNCATGSLLSFLS